MAVIDYFRNATGFTEFEAEQIIFDEQQPGDVMYAVREGEVDIIHNGRVLATITAGGTFGEMALVDASPRSARAVARTDCKVVPVDRDRFVFLIQETPTFALQVMHTLAERLRQMNEIV